MFWIMLKSRRRYAAVSRQPRDFPQSLKENIRIFSWTWTSCFFPNFYLIFQEYSLFSTDCIQRCVRYSLLNSLILLAARLDYRLSLSPAARSLLFWKSGCCPGHNSRRKSGHTDTRTHVSFPRPHLRILSSHRFHINTLQNLHSVPFGYTFVRGNHNSAARLYALFLVFREVSGPLSMYYRLGCGAMKSARSLPTFWSMVLPPSSG
jgi:hypothetical protein